eukprot:1200761-Rhodomonas_salina.1
MLRQYRTLRSERAAPYRASAPPSFVRLYVGLTTADSGQRNAEDEGDTFLILSCEHADSNQDTHALLAAALATSAPVTS